MEKTTFRYLEPSDQYLGLPQPPLERSAAGQIVDLPSPDTCPLSRIDLTEAIAARQSVRTYRRSRLSLSELSYLLWCTQGVRSVEGTAWTFRTVPSAGARHALETFLLVNRVDGIDSGLYRYAALDHRLVTVDAGPEIATEIAAACLAQPMIPESAVTFLWSADIYRMNWRYGERGYRYVFIEAGHACQNLYLAVEAVGCGVCAIGAFDDDLLNALLGLDGRDWFVLYLATVGKTDR